MLPISKWYLCPIHASSQSSQEQSRVSLFLAAHSSFANMYRWLECSRRSPSETDFLFLIYPHTCTFTSKMQSANTYAKEKCRHQNHTHLIFLKVRRYPQNLGYIFGDYQWNCKATSVSPTWWVYHHRLGERERERDNDLDWFVCRRGKAKRGLAEGFMLKQTVEE